jgi:RNA polymerase-associated protein CTR9
MELGELLVQSDWATAMEYLKTARNLLKKAGEKIPIELLNGIGLLHFEKGELEVCYCTLHIKYFTVIYN